MAGNKGIIVGCSAKMEYLLPYFYLNLRLNSHLPIVFFDFGMTAFGKLFCEKRGKVIEIKDSLYETSSFDHRSMIKSMWFKKPLAFKNAPFEINLWLDLDCKIIKPFEDIFNYLDDKWIAIFEEKFPDLPSPVFNSGVCVFKKDAPFIDDWIKLSRDCPEKFRGDQNALTSILTKKRHQVSLLPQKYNYLYRSPEINDSENIVIFHHICIFKLFLQKEYLILEGVKNLTSFDPKFVELK